VKSNKQKATKCPPPNYDKSVETATIYPEVKERECPVVQQLDAKSHAVLEDFT
jgi:hypothetical protein